MSCSGGACQRVEQVTIDVFLFLNEGLLAGELISEEGSLERGIGRAISRGFIQA